MVFFAQFWVCACAVLFSLQLGRSVGKLPLLGDAGERLSALTTGCDGERKCLLSFPLRVGEFPALDAWPTVRGAAEKSTT